MDVRKGPNDKMMIKSNKGIGERAAVFSRNSMAEQAEPGAATIREV